MRATWHDLHVRRFPVPTGLLAGGSYIRNSFSNFERCSRPLELFGQRYGSVEAAFVAAKNTDPAWRARVAAMAPSRAKQAGRAPGVLRPDWDAVSLAAMWSCLLAKWAPGRREHGELLAMVEPVLVEWTNWGADRTPDLAAATGSLERNGVIDPAVAARILRAPGDRIWGVGASMADDGLGRNAFGLMLTVLRHAARSGRWPRPLAEEEWPDLQARLVRMLNAIPPIAGMGEVVIENGAALRSVVAALDHQDEPAKQGGAPCPG